jgi:hypothetical protein
MTTIAAALTLAFGMPAFAQQQQQQQQSQTTQERQTKGGDERMKGIVTASGKVLGNAEIKTTAGDMHRLVKLQRIDGGTVVVDLGVSAPEVQQGDRIFVQGHAARISGKPVIFARYFGELQQVGSTDTAGAAAGGSTADDDWLEEDWLEDDFGYYDEDFRWTSDNSGFVDFYGDADEAWGALYDDVGDEGLFDV